MKKIAFSALAALVFAACSSSQDTIDDNDNVIDMMPRTRSVNLSQEQREFIRKNTDFSFSLFRTVSQMPEGRKSSILSPISVTYVMGMLNDGAAGNTAKEITSVLGFGEADAQAVNDLCKVLIDEAPQTDPSVTLEIANTVISNKHRDVKLESQYEHNMKNYYSAELSAVDFSKPQEALKNINGWCNEKTHGMIPEILKESELDPNALLVLMNAIYFKATWATKFDAKDTKTKTFTTESGQKKQMPMMHGKLMAEYGETDDFQMLTLPYGSGNLWAMRVLLPREGKTVDDIISALGTEMWQQLPKDCFFPIVDLDFPRFDTAFETDLTEPLAQMGAPSMFIPRVAEFPGVSTNFKKDLYVSLMKQKAAIEVSEEGTKASAVTVAEMNCAASFIDREPEKPKTVEFHADRPFVYAIQEYSTGAIFFLGTYRGE